MPQPKKKSAASDGYFRHREVYNGVKIDIRALDKRELDEKVRQKKNEIDSGSILNRKIVSVKTWGLEWLEVYIKPEVIDKSYKLYKTNFEKYIISNIGSMLITDVKPIHLKKILMSQTGKSKSHVSHIRCAITSMFRAALDNNMITSDPSKGLKLPEDLSEGTHRPLTGEETELMFKAAIKHYLGLYILIMYHCGLRPSEVSALKWRDIDFDKKLLHVAKAIESNTRKDKETKTSSGERYIPIPEDFYPVLFEKQKGKEDLIVTDLKGRVCKDRYFQNYYRNFLRQMDIEAGAEIKNNKIIVSKLINPPTSYCLRHTYCTNLLRAGVPITITKYFMGHKDTRMVDRIYGHHTPDQTETARKMIDEFNNVGSKTGSEAKTTRNNHME